MAKWVYPDSIGRRLTIARKYLQLSQGAVATFLGTSRQTVAAWELDRDVPKGSHLIGLVNLLRRTPNELFGLDPWTGPGRARAREVPADA